MLAIVPQRQRPDPDSGSPLRPDLPSQHRDFRSPGVEGLDCSRRRPARRSISRQATRVCARLATTRRRTLLGRLKCSAEFGSNTLWFDTSVFSAPPAGTWGNVQRNMLLTGPGPRCVDRKDRSVRRPALGHAGGLLQRDEHTALRESERDAGERELRPCHSDSRSNRADDPVRRTLPVLRKSPYYGTRNSVERIPSLEPRIPCIFPL
jgi:hypothetical protein